MCANRPTAPILLACALLLAPACRPSEPEAPPPAEAPAPEQPVRALSPPRGMWVLCEGSRRVLDDPPRVDAMLEDARRLGVTDLFIQVHRRGRAWFDSTQADSSPYRAIREKTGGDPLAALIPRAHEAGMRVHAWVNVLSLADNRDAPIVRDLGRDAVLTDQRGRSLLDYPRLDVPPPDRDYYRMGTPAVWLDPAVPAVVDRLVETYVELLQRYPELDGLHLDYIRYPDVLPFVPGSRFGVGLDFGYGAGTRARFLAETGLTAPFGDSTANATRWDDWRRERLTDLVRRVREGLRALDPEIQLSAAVWTYADRAYLSLRQDWRGWLELGLLDFAVTMAYTLDDRIFRYQVESFANAPNGERVWIGIGAWLFAKRPERAVEQVRIARRSGAAGDALFSYDSIADAPALRDALAREADAGN